MQAVMNTQQISYLLNQALTNQGEIGDADAMECFLEDLGKLIAEHFGGEFDEVIMGHDCLDDRIVINLADESVPKGGGIYKSSLGLIVNN